MKKLRKIFLITAIVIVALIGVVFASNNIPALAPVKAVIAKAMPAPIAKTLDIITFNNGVSEEELEEAKYYYLVTRYEDQNNVNAAMNTIEKDADVNHPNVKPFHDIAIKNAARAEEIISRMTLTQQQELQNIINKNAMNTKNQLLKEIENEKSLLQNQ